jgi:hypothetical protein
MGSEWILRRLAGGGGGLDSTGSAGCCQCSDEISSFCATELVSGMKEGNRPKLVASFLLRYSK